MWTVAGGNYFACFFANWQRKESVCSYASIDMERLLKRTKKRTFWLCENRRCIPSFSCFSMERNIKINEEINNNNNSSNQCSDPESVHRMRKRIILFVLLFLCWESGEDRRELNEIVTMRTAFRSKSYIEWAFFWKLKSDSHPLKIDCGETRLEEQRIDGAMSLVFILKSHLAHFCFFSCVSLVRWTKLLHHQHW